jgi:hypothetical protein
MRLELNPCCNVVEYGFDVVVELSAICDASRNSGRWPLTFISALMNARFIYCANTEQYRTKEASERSSIGSFEKTHS